MVVAGHHRPARTRPRRRTGVTLSGQSSAALGAADERARLLAIASIILFCTPQPSELAALAGTEGVAEGALRVDGEELTAGRRSPSGQVTRRPDAVGQSPTGKADLIVRSLAERVRIIRPRVPASVETVARSPTALPQPRPATRGLRGGGHQSGGTWAVQPHQPPFGSFNPGLIRLAALRSGIPAARSGRGAPTSRPRKAGPAPAVTERTRSEMPSGRRRWATASLTGTSSGQTGPPRFPATTPEVSGPPKPTFRCDPIPCRFRRAPPVSPPEPLGRTAVNLAAGTGCRMCHWSQGDGDLRHMPGFR